MGLGLASGSAWVSGKVTGMGSGTATEWPGRLLTKKLEDAQRLELGLPKARGLSSRRITGRMNTNSVVFASVFERLLNR